jgi:ribonuclease-3
MTLNLNNDFDIIKNDDDTLIFDPYNEKNIEIKLNDIQSILKKYGLPPIVNNINLYKRAFVHKSYVKRPLLENKENNIILLERPSNCMKLKTKSNERLEFLGDGVLECITKYYLYRRFTKGNEGFMTEKKIALVKNENIGKLAYEMGLNKWYIISKHAEEKKIRTNHKKLGCLFESFLGALFLDMNKINIKDDDKWFENFFVTGPGLQMAQKFVENIFETHINWNELIHLNDNYKNILQVKIQKKFKKTPIYMIISQNEDTGYEVGVYLDINIPIEKVVPQNALEITTSHDTCLLNYIEELLSDNNNQGLFLLASSKHKIKKKAEQTACEIALKRIN